MSGLSKEEKIRNSGAEWMLRLAEEKGIEAARAEFDQRNIRGIPLKFSMADVDRMYKEERRNLMYGLAIIAVISLHDEFGFGTERLNRFIHKFTNQADCLNKNYTSWEEVQKIILDETGILIPIGGVSE